MHILSYLCPLAEQDHEDCNFLSMPRLTIAGRDTMTLALAPPDTDGHSL